MTDPWDEFSKSLAEESLPRRESLRRMQVSASCVYPLIETGKLPHFRIGIGRGVIRILEEDLNSYLTASRPSPAPATFTVRRGRLRNMKF